MNDFSRSDKLFLEKVSGLIKDNISNERFGVSELAGELAMSRSNLLRKIKKLTGVSVSIFIRNIRLDESIQLLKKENLSISEISYEVGFGSVSYFVKCFRDRYGYPPGDAEKRGFDDKKNVGKNENARTQAKLIYYSLFVVVLLALLFIFNPFSGRSSSQEKSIAVLPFINDSNDSTNLYLINGLMESILNNLQKIEDLRVVSRTSVEKYRLADKTISEIGKELNVQYVIEGSGQKEGEEILLSIQLIETDSDRHLWSEQFRREPGDIFDLQSEIARTIASYVKATITPDEEKRINKAPTGNLIAYDYFLKGLDRFHAGTVEGVEESIILFKKALEYDDEFARAYADLSIAYSILDIYKAEKEYTEMVLSYADKALLYDPELEQSLIAKSLYYMGSNDPDRAIPFLEKAHKNSPNSAVVLNMLSEYYANYNPNTEKYLEYALKGINIDIAGNDSTDASFAYLHVGNSFMQTGFIDEAEFYIKKSLDFDQGNLYSAYVLAFVYFAKTGNLEKSREMLINVLNNDPSRYDIIQEIAKISYYIRDYKSADIYYSQFLKIKENLGIDIYDGEDAKISFVFDKTGRQTESDSLLNKYFEFARQDESIYKNLNFTAYYSYIGELEKSIDYFRKFSNETRYNYLVIPFIKIDPLLENLREHPDYNKVLKKLEDGFLAYHEAVRKNLENKGLLRN